LRSNCPTSTGGQLAPHLHSAAIRVGSGNWNGPAMPFCRTFFTLRLLRS
jgi:hypothetical protein